MKKLFVVTMIGLFLSVPIFAKAASFTGTIQGFMCVTQGKVCPIGKEDPVAAAENIFVLLVDAAKGEYYFLPNIDRDVLVRYLNKEITVDGTLNNKFKSVQVKEISVKGKEVWSADAEERMKKELLSGD